MLQLSEMNSAHLAREILRSDECVELAAIRSQAQEIAASALADHADIRSVCRFMSEIHDALTSHLVTLAIQSVSLPEGLVPSFCWLSFGSAGRGEQVLPTDQDNAIVFAETADDLREVAVKYYLQIGKSVCEGLYQCGFELCPGDTMASNPVWCKPLSTWIRYFHEWMSVPREDALMNAAICFDFRPVSGDVSLGTRLRRVIDEELEFERTALVLMAKNVIWTPDALGFWGKMIVERKGTERGLFDLKLRIMKPLVDAARVLSLDQGLHSITNTVDRFIAVADRDAGLREGCRRAAETFAYILQLRNVNGLARGDNGRYVGTYAMTKEEASKLKEACETVRAMQTLVRVRFQLDALGLG